MPVPVGKKAGRISKPNGLDGSVSAVLLPAAGHDIKTDHPLFIDMDGQRVPFFVERFQEISENEGIIKFEFIGSVEEAREICGRDLYFDLPDTGSAESPEEDYALTIGYQAMDHRLGPLGPVKDFIPNEMNPVFLVDYRGKELIIPAADKILKLVDTRKRIILFDLPEGLTEL